MAFKMRNHISSRRACEKIACSRGIRRRARKQPIGLRYLRGKLAIILAQGKIKEK